MNFKSGLLSACLLGAAPWAAHAESLADALIVTEATNPQLDSGRADAAIADEALTQARAAGRTTVNVTASAGGQQSETNQPFALVEGDAGLANAQIDVARPIYTSGRVPAGIRSAKAGIDAADLSLQDLRQAIFFDVVTAYMDVVRDLEAVRIRRNNVDVLAEQLRAAEDRFNVGVVTRTDVKLSEARLEGARANEASAQAQLESSRANYTFLVGQRPTDLVSPPDLPVPATLEDTLTVVLSDNPTLNAAKANERSAAEQVKVAKGSGGLQVDIVGQASGQEFYQDEQSPLRDTTLSALARARLPLWQGGLVRSQVREAKLRREQAKLQTQNVERQVRAQTAAAWYAYISAQQAIIASERQVEAAQVAFDGAREELSVGTRTTQDLLDAEQDLLNARLTLVSSERDSYVAAARLYQIMGSLTPEAVSAVAP
ncbi:MAG: TolC family outer membrane protein [Pseudomonadota bacterium]